MNRCPVIGVPAPGPPTTPRFENWEPVCAAPRLPPQASDPATANSLPAENGPSPGEMSPPPVLLAVPPPPLEACPVPPEADPVPFEPPPVDPLVHAPVTHETVVGDEHEQRIRTTAADKVRHHLRPSQESRIAARIPQFTCSCLG